ncbi:alpha-L-fucosidase [Saonia flava]|uniref:alpha-L-fucosidase n=1 Tax=Saonia flava TaxID=523696 RepID=A0A846QR68_9FLAO|nr:alpha-L-fucosidase [Saonia flava]NJB70598.1 alpha-L-fucosidase [Saonia flava]
MKKSIFPLFSLILIITSCKTEKIADFQPKTVVPSVQQLAYQKMEMVGFIHFTVNTYTDKEWGYGDENPIIFNPEELDAEQWVLAAKAGGLKELILTAKHHDGFCLWPSKFTEHSVKNSPYKDGQGNVVKEFVDACKKHGLKVGLYLSPWDRNHADYGKPEYITYYRNQLKELLTNYGEINEIWFDGANGGDGFYGGANEERKIDRSTYYDWENTFSLVKNLQPNIMIFSDAGPDIRWVGNEHGHAGQTFWSSINGNELTIGGDMADYLNIGESDGNSWLIGQCDVSIRPGWFYHEAQDSLVKTPKQLTDIYYKSVGRNGVLLVNLPPNKKGLIHSNDVKNLKGFKEIIDETFKTNLVEGAKVTASNYRLENERFSPLNILDSNSETFWTTDDSVLSAELIIETEKPITFNRLLLQEPIKYGQRIEKFEVSIEENGAWKSISNETTIGYKRLIRIENVTTRKIKIKIVDANAIPALSNFEVFLATKE